MKELGSSRKQNEPQERVRAGGWRKPISSIFRRFTDDTSPITMSPTIDVGQKETKDMRVSRKTDTPGRSGWGDNILREGDTTKHPVTLLNVVRFGTPGRVGINGKWEIAAGDIDDPNFIPGYTKGNCYELATAISRVTSWPIWTMEIVEPETGRQLPAHWGVITSDGKFLDAHGASSPEKLAQLFPDKPINLRRWGTKEEIKPPDPELVAFAMSFVGPLLQREGYEDALPSQLKYISKYNGDSGGQ